jgi:hypothetical protein
MVVLAANKTKHGDKMRKPLWTLTLFAIAASVGLPARGQSFGTYANYTFPDSMTSERLDVFTRWEAVPPAGTFYPALQFGFEHGSGGYFGFQLVGTTRKVLFSIWDDPHIAGTAVPMGDCRRFGGEGEGAQCLSDFPWVLGDEYQFVLEKARRENGMDVWRVTVTDTSDSSSRQVGEIGLKDVPQAATGYGKISGSWMVSWIENFGGYAWRGPFLVGNGGKSVGPSRSGTHYSGCPGSNVFSPVRDVVVQEAGPTVVRQNAEGAILWH